jgi:hypothetical protein
MYISMFEYIYTYIYIYIYTSVYVYIHSNNTYHRFVCIYTAKVEFKITEKTFRSVDIDG